MRPDFIEMIRAEARGTPVPKPSAKGQQYNQGFDAATEPRLMVTRPANDWLNTSRTILQLKTLFGSLWHEGELCILFADTNLGKSVLAVQIADAITRNYSLGSLNNQAAADTPVLYLDCEQTSQQFEARYSCLRHGRHHFSPHFYRTEYNPALDAPTRRDNYHHYMQGEIEHALAQTGARVLIIDNLTYMRQGSQSATQSLALMKALKALKTQHNLSVLVLAHTPKRSATMPLSVNDLQGSKMLINFADSAFAIGQSMQDAGLRYLKQIKQRSAQQTYGAGNVYLIRMQQEFGFLGYQFEGLATEAEHLHQPTPQNAEHDAIVALYTQGHSLRQIAARVGMHYTTVGRAVRRYQDQQRLKVNAGDQLESNEATSLITNQPFSNH